jgi:hypothetical protein
MKQATFQLGETPDKKNKEPIIQEQEHVIQKTIKNSTAIVETTINIPKKTVKPPIKNVEHIYYF